MTSPLLEAVRGNHIAATRLLLDYGGNMNIRDISLNKPLLHIAANHEDMVKLLLEYGIDPNSRTCCYRVTLLDMYNKDKDMNALIKSYGGKVSRSLGINYYICWRCSDTISNDFSYSDSDWSD